jgi:multidrug efflux pump subunit AcrA (membrane-fusion protein)
MKTDMFLFLSLCTLLGMSLSGCESVTTAEEPPETIQTPVTVTAISHEPMNQFVELNATSSFLQKNYLKANATGYLRSAPIKPGQEVMTGQLLFTIKTKEAESLGSTITMLDSSFRFSGVNLIHVGVPGFIAEINHQDGDYVQDGEQLAVVSDIHSFVFLLNLPYELRAMAPLNKKLKLFFADGDSLTGMVSSIMPMMDSVDQTQRVVIKVNPVHQIPENLIARVRLEKPGKAGTISLPKSAVLANETQTEFWIMKVIDSITAVKVRVIKGVESNGRIEIISPTLNDRDRIIASGNYGLSDTARINVIPPQH